MVVTAELLKRFPILEPLTDAELNNLATHSKVDKFARRAIILTAGQEEDSIYFLFEGRLQGVDFTIDGREVGLYFVEPGGFCGELALFDKSPQPEHVIATTPSVTVKIHLAKMREVMQAQPKILETLGIKLTGRIREMTRQRSLLGLPNIAQRVCCQLWSLVPEDEKRGSQVSEIKNPPTHMEIAIMLNVSRETVSRVFQTLQGHGIVRRDGNAKLKIIQLELLKAWSEGRHEDH